MSNFYGSYIGFGGGGGSTQLAGWYGTIGITGMGGYYPNRNEMDYITIASEADALDFGDLITAVRGVDSMGNGIGGRGISVGGSVDSGQGNGGASYQPGLQYVTFTSTGNAAFFGNLLVGAYNPNSGGNDGIRGMKFGGEGGSPYYNPSIDYVTVATTMDALDFGDMYGGGASGGSSVNDGTTSLTCGYYRAAPASHQAEIQVVTTQTTGNATDWGPVFPVAWSGGCGSSSDSGRGVLHISDTTPPPGYSNTMEYLTIQTAADALDFGDITGGSYWSTIGKLSNGVRGVVAGGYPSANIIDHYVFASLGNSADFGNLTVGRSMCDGISGS
jgi:hypothetical protein